MNDTKLDEDNLTLEKRATSPEIITEPQVEFTEEAESEEVNLEDQPLESCASEDEEEDLD